MKRKIKFLAISLFIFHFSLLVVSSQTWKELYDSANVYIQNSKYQTAIEWAEKALVQAEKEFGKMDTNYVGTLNVIYLCFYNQGEYQKAIEFCEKSRLIIMELKGNKSNEYAEILNNLGIFYEMINNFNEAEQLKCNSLEIWRKLFNGDNLNLADGINNLAIFYYNRGRYDEAESLLIEALEMRRRLSKGDDNNLASFINNMAVFYQNRGNYIAAEPLYKESLDMTRRLFKIDHPDLAIGINNLGYFYENISNYSEAEQLYKEALEMRRRLFKGDHRDLASGINNMAAFYNARSRYTEAEQLFMEALEMKRRIYKGDNSDIALSINNIAAFYNERGRLTEAEQLYKEALEMNRRLFKSEHPDLASSLNNIALFYYQNGRNNEANPLFKEALEMFRHLYNVDNPKLATSINNMAYFYNGIGLYDEAEALYYEALEMRRRLFKGDHKDLALSINNMANFYERKSRDVEAEKLYIEALEMFRRLYNVDNPQLAIIINNFAFFNKKKGQYSEAETLFKEGIEMKRRLFRSNHPELAKGIYNMAMFYYERGIYSEAELLYKEGFEIYKRMLDGYFPSLSENEKKLIWSTVSENFETFNTFAIDRDTKNQNILSNMYDMQLYTKAILFNSTRKAKKRILNSNDSLLLNKYYAWLDKKALLSKLYGITSEARIKKGFNLDSIENVANNLEKELTLKSEDFKKEYDRKQYEFKDIQTILNKDESAIEFIRFRKHGKVPNKFNPTILEDGFTDTVFYAALIVTKDTKEYPELVLLENGNDLEGKWINLYSNLIDMQRKKVFDTDKINAGLKSLYNNFWKPIKEKLKGIKTVYLSLDGVYNKINLNTLVNPVTNKYLLQELDLRIVSSTRDIIERQQKSATIEKDNQTIALFGDPQYNLDSAEYVNIASAYANETTRDYYFGSGFDTLTRGNLVSLPGTKIEVEEISKAFKKQKWDVNTFLGKDALEEAVKSLESPRVLHISTHGKFLKDVELQSDYLTMGIDKERYVENPLLRSFLTFAGAEQTLNEPSKFIENREDGLLTAYEAMNLNLDNTELVVLSACETGLGEIKNGEGVYGLQRAFLVAGAKSLIMSLWNVSDDATQKLMINFYTKWLSGKTKRDAFREAQIEVMKDYPGFYYWGAFVMVGID